MPLSLDHIVIAVADLDAAFKDYGALGFQVVRGGEHANGNTHNVLVVFEDGAYLELIAWKRPDPGFRWSDTFQRSGEGFVDYALLPSEMGSDVAGMQSRGLDMADPTPGGRLRPDGERLEWQTARSTRSDVPFLCGDVTPRRLRVPEGDVRRHPNGVTGVAALTVAVNDLDESLPRYAALLGVDPAGAATSRVVPGFGMRAATLPVGEVALTLASPLGSEGPLAQSLEARGEGPFAVAFRSGREVGDLDRALSHGARLAIVGAGR